MPKTEPFDHFSNEYDDWFTDNKYVFQSELKAIKKVLPKGKNGIEIGVGSGIFAEPLGIKEGIEPSKAMREKAKQRNIEVINAVAEKLPYRDKSKDFVLMVTTICFVDDIYKSFEEVKRILKDNGSLIVGFVDKNSPVGKVYLKHQNESIFYKDATFFGTEELFEILRSTGFEINNTYQTVFGQLNEINEVQNILAGYGVGSFVVIEVIKERES